MALVPPAAPREDAVTPWLAADVSDVEERLDASADLVADRADLVDAEAGGIVELPVLVALAREERAGVAAAHRDDDVGGPDDLVGPRLRQLAA